MTHPPCMALALSLRRGNARALQYDCLDSLLNWLNGGKRPRAQPFLGVLGDPSTDLELLRRVYALLDRALFVRGELFTPVIEMTSVPSPETVTQRYRTLVLAFHPDRYPALSEWLTPRSQAINAAYAIWKDSHKGSGNQAAAPSVQGDPYSQPGSRDWPHKIPKAPDTWLRLHGFRLLGWFRHTLGHVVYLPQKILLVTFILCTIPIAYLAYQPRVKPWADAGMDEMFAEVPQQANAPLPLAFTPRLDAWLAMQEPPIGRLQGTDQGHGNTLKDRLAKGQTQNPNPSSTPRTKRVTSKGSVTPQAGKQVSSPQSRSRKSVARLHTGSVTKSHTPSKRPDRAGAQRPASETEMVLDPTRQSDRVAHRARTGAPKRETPAAIVPNPSSPLTYSSASPSKTLLETRDAIDEHQIPGLTRSLTEFMGTYRASFERGDLEGFLRHFSPAARENHRSGIDWLRAAYGKVFRETKVRRLKLNITLISQRASRWNLQANYHLEFVYRDERHAHRSGQIDYTLERNGKSWRIAQIRY